MASDKWQGRWEQVKGKLKATWADLTDDDLETVKGHQQQLAGRIQERYGIAKEEAEKQIKKFRSENDDYFQESDWAAEGDEYRGTGGSGRRDSWSSDT